MRLFIFIALFGLVSARGEVVYEKEIAPILRTYCAGCHNNDEHENQFSVETFSSLRKGGEDHGDPVKPGNADESHLVALPEEPPRLVGVLPHLAREVVERVEFHLVTQPADEREPHRLAVEIPREIQ